MISKLELLELLKKETLYELFEALAEVFKSEEDDYFDAYVAEFQFPSANYNEVQFRSRLRLFINTHKKFTQTNSSIDKLNYYEALCDVDFKLQTEHFQQIYRHKKIAAFLLHGESDEQGNDIRWLYNQLMYKENLNHQAPVIIDFSSKLGGGYTRLLEDMYVAFNINTNNAEDALNELIFILQGKLLAGSIICIIKSPESLLNNPLEISKLFNEFLFVMNKNMFKKTSNNAFVFLFVESKQVDYHLSKDDYFFCYTSETQNNYSENAVNCSGLKIIDLAPIEELKESDISQWIGSTLPNPDLYNKVKTIKNQESKILDEGKRPFQAIKGICKELRIELNESWIK